MSKLKVRNAVLALRIADLGLTQRELSEEINAVCERVTGDRGTTNDRYVRQLLDGTVLWPRDRYRRPLEIIFGCTALELGFIPPLQKGYSPSSTMRTFHSDPKQEKPPVNRRDFTRLAAGMAVSVVLPDLTGGRRVSMSDVDALRSNFDVLHALDDRYGGGVVAGFAMESAQRIHAGMDSCHMSERVQRALHSVAGTYASTAGWFAYDAGDDKTAQRYFDHALRAALISRDPMLQAQTWNYMSLHAGRLNKPAEALAIAQAGLSSPLVRRDPKIAALFHSRVALRLAKKGERGMAQRSMGRAFDALDRDDGRQPPPWLAFLDIAELVGLSALVGLHLGQYRLAESRAREALSLLPDTYARNRLYYTVQLALGQLGARHVEHACATAHDALDLAASTRSARSLDRLNEFRQRVAAWGTAEAQSWVDRFDTMREARR